MFKAFEMLFLGIFVLFILGMTLCVLAGLYLIIKDLFGDDKKKWK